MDESGFEQRERERRAREQQRLGDRFTRESSPEDRGLGEEYAQSNAIDGPRIGDTFADPRYAEETKLGNSFADPNSIDDGKLGKSFEETNSSRKKKHDLHVKEKLTPKGTRKFLYWFVLGVVVLFAAIFILSIIPRLSRDKENNKRAQQQKDAVPAIEVVTVKRSQGGSGLVVPGTTTPLVQAFVYARANGYLKTRLVDIGDHVRRGQLLAVIDAPDLDQQVDQARQQLRQAEAQVGQQRTQLALNKVTWDRWRVLVAKGVFARQDGDQREADYLAQQANVAAAERNVQAYQANLQRVIALQSYEQVRSPFDGVITARNVDVGSLISAAGTSSGAASPSVAGASAGQQNAALTNSAGASGSSATSATPTGGGDTGGQPGALFSIAQVQRLRILVSVPDSYAGGIKVGQHAAIHFQQYATAQFDGNVTRTADSIDQNTRTLLTEVQVDNRDGRLMAGMYAVVTFDTAGGPGPLMVPGDAIVIRENQTMVATIANDKVSMRPVDIGRDFGPSVEVVAGLREGDVIATNVTDEVSEGAKVQTKPSPMEQQNQSKGPPPTVPPGGPSQYGDQSISDQNLQGQANQKQGQQKGQQKGGDKKSGSGSKP
ncbi:efflux RND transporter periplasmic adaptor subunit [Granulicella sibirica]|uniref:Putative Co/Zn/Cd efflux system membrane fusion protein n=1 Tax=Granulicella sibirica TaxID=2479048 RepID=A0A4Q0SVA6_9BACT|nr:efflux RND transporter periplasmic adaptor subunit [Granulicella sibirica]RXH54292.1 putative Co/Zn/Cd efflux system membrane fusion protein [Granulicella sibirica]